MPHRNLRRCLILLIVLAACPLFAQTYNMGASPQRILTLNGKWRFHPGDNPLWASPTYNDSSWPLLNSSQSWAEQGYLNLSGYAWYRFTVKVPAATPPISILLSPIFTGYQFYENGHLIASCGNTHPTFLVQQPLFATYPVTTTTSTQNQTIHFALRVWHSPLWSQYEGGGPVDGGESVLGPARMISTIGRFIQMERLNEGVDQYVGAFLSGIIGIIVLTLFLLRSSEREYLWFAIMQLAGCLADILNLSFQARTALPIPISDLLSAILVAVIWISSLHFFSTILNQRRGVWFRLSFLLAALSPFTIPLCWPGWLSIPVSGLLQALLILPSTLWVLALLARRTYRRDTDAVILLAPAALNYGYYIVQSVAVSLDQFHLVIGVPWFLRITFPVYPFHLSLTTLFNILFIVALLIFLIRRFSHARGREEHFNHQIAAARHVQQLLIPESAPDIPGFAIEAVYFPADIVGGDFFQQIPDSDGGLVLVVGDVSGKGLPAAMMVSLLVGVIHAETARTSDPAEILTALNERLIAQPHEGFATCLVAHLSSSGEMRLACAGHIPPFRNGVAIEMDGALPIGVVPGAEPSTLSIRLDPGDRLTFISDGVLEAQSPTGELFGFERTCHCSTMTAPEIAEIALRFGQEDDITVLTLDFHPHPSPIPA